MNLNTARVFVRDIKKAKVFYASALGLPVKAEGLAQGYCVFNAGNSELVIESVAPDAPEEDQALVGRFTGLSFQVADVHKKYTELSAKGVEFSGLPEQQFWGGTLATLRDPDGNQLQIVHRPAA
jgi:catechol 2,3-dioxygenase-like lactoylglutathione lyase family enzyme